MLDNTSANSFHGFILPGNSPGASPKQQFAGAKLATEQQQCHRNDSWVENQQHRSKNAT